MKKMVNILLFHLITISICLGQESSIDKIRLNKLIKEFEQSIIEKDSTRFKELFFDETVPFVGIMSEKTEWSIKRNYSDFEGVSISNCKKFITDICKTKKKQVEKFYDIKTDTDGYIGSISFDYSYHSGEKMIQWGNEKWNLVKLDDKWLITDVIYSIHFPDIEKFPFGKKEKLEKE